MSIVELVSSLKDLINECKNNKANREQEIAKQEKLCIELEQKKTELAKEMQIISDAL